MIVRTTLKKQHVLSTIEFTLERMSQKRFELFVKVNCEYNCKWHGKVSVNVCLAHVCTQIKKIYLNLSEK